MDMSQEITSAVTVDELWKKLMLEPKDYSPDAINHPVTRELMNKMRFENGGEAYDIDYPKGIPTSMTIRYNGKAVNSGYIMFPAGHARNTDADLHDILNYKFNLLGLTAL